MGALRAARDMPAERRGAAVLDGRHHLQLAKADMAGVGSAPCRSMIAEDVRDLQCRTRHARRALSGRLGPLDLAGDMLQRADHFADHLGGDARIKRRAIELGVPEQKLDSPKIAGAPVNQGGLRSPARLRAAMAPNSYRCAVPNT